MEISTGSERASTGTSLTKRRPSSPEVVFRNAEAAIASWPKFRLKILARGQYLGGLLLLQFSGIKDSMQVSLGTILEISF